MKFVIDRIEENISVCQRLDNKEVFEILLEKLPVNTKEGTVIFEENGQFVIDKAEEEIIKKRIKEKMNKLWN